jgi:hypothetical protein
MLEHLKLAKLFYEYADKKIPEMPKGVDQYDLLILWLAQFTK